MGNANSSTLPLAPAYPTDTPTSTPVTTFKTDAAWRILDETKIYLQGFSSESQEPRASLKKWLETNNAAIEHHGLK